MEYLLKASIVIAVFYLCFRLFLKKETFFQHNRIFLFLGLVLALVFPLIIIPVYVTIDPVIAPENALFSKIDASQITETSKTSVFSVHDILYLIYTTGVSFLFIQFLFQFGSLISLLIKHPKTKEGVYTFVKVKSKIAPFSFFKWIVYNPETYNDDELKLILTHEKVHVNQLHSLDILFAQLACVMFWFNPLVWFYRNNVRQNLEYIADDKTQFVSQNDKAYQYLLLKNSILNANNSLSNHFYNSQIKKRIIMLQKSKSNHKKQWRFTLVLPLLALMLISMNKETIYVAAEDSIETKTKNQTDPIKIIFNKSITDGEIDEISKQLKAHGVSMHLKKIKRNKEGEITAINIDFEANGNKANYGISSSEAIKPFYFEMNDETFGVGTLKYDETIIVEEINTEDLEQPSKSKTKSKIIIRNDSVKESNRFIYTKDTTKVESISETISIIEPDKKTLNNTIKQESKKYYNGDKPMIINKNGKTEIIYPQENKIIYRNSDNPKPLIIIDGKEVNYNKINKVNPNSIEKIDVLKDKNAMTLYGEKGQNGVIIITTNGNYTWTPKSETTKEGPWKITNAVSSVKYIDDENPSDNALLSYVSKFTTDNILNENKSKFDKMGISVKYSKIKRDKSGNITRIKIVLKDNQGKESSATFSDNDGIPDIEYGLKNGKLIVRSYSI